MDRRNFVFGTAIVGGSFLFGCSENASAVTTEINKNADTLYVPPNNDRIKLSYEDTGNQLTTVEFKLPPKTCGPAPHFHEDLDEIVRVISGTLTVMVEDQIIEVPEGGWHFRPRKKIHGFWNATDLPVHFIEIYPNQNFDVMLQKVWNLREQYLGKGIALDTPEVWSALDKIQQQWGITMYHERRNEIIEKYGLQG